MVCVSDSPARVRTVEANVTPVLPILSGVKGSALFVERGGARKHVNDLLQ